MDFNRLTYLQVKSCLSLIKNVATWNVQAELFCQAFGISEDIFWKCGIKEYFQAQNHLLEALNNLVEREQKLLKSIDIQAGIWEQAGGERLAKFGNIMPLVQLGEIYSIFPYDLQHKPYNEILTLLVCHKEKAEVDRAYQKIITK